MRFEHAENQPAALVEQPVVLARSVHQLVQPVAHIDIALAQQFDLPLDQRHRMAGFVRHDQVSQQLVVLDEKGRVALQKLHHAGGFEFVRMGRLFFHTRICPS